MKARWWWTMLLLAGMIQAGGCNQKSAQSQRLDTPTAGHIRITVDESLKPLIASEIQAFQSIYPQANIEASYVSEAVAMEAFLEDSARLVILGRKLLPEEVLVLDTQRIVAQQVKAAIDGVALILNRENPDSLLSFRQVADIIQGNIQHWQQINEHSTWDEMQVVFDHTQSGMVRWMMDSVAKVESLPSHCFAVDNNEEVIHYVSQTPQAIGLIGLSWISDRNDSISHGFLEQIRVVGITSRQDSLGTDYYQPYQAYLAQKKYPLTREVYIISREARTGLGSGFMAFVCGDKGQRIVLKSGLLPATMPIRIVQLVSD